MELIPFNDIPIIEEGEGGYWSTLGSQKTFRPYRYQNKMIHEKKISVGNYLKRGEDFKDGDLLIVMGECIEVPGEFGTQKTFKVKVGEKEGNTVFNQTSINGLVDAYGKDDKEWIGKEIKAHKVKQNVSGKFIDVWYFSHPDAELTEKGFIIPNKLKIEDDSADEVDVRDIPF